MTWNSTQSWTPKVNPSALVRQQRTIKPFDRILLQGYGQLEIVMGQAPALTVASHEKFIDRIGSQVVDGRLILGFESWWDRFRQSFSTSLNRQPILYRLVVCELAGLEIRGVAQVRGRGIQGKLFDLRVHGLADIQLNEVRASALNVHMAPGGRVRLDGKVQEQRITIRGPGEYAAHDLASQTAQITIQGPGQAAVNVQDDLQVQIAGPGRVTYAGAPSIVKRLIGPAILRPVARYQQAAR